CFPQPTKKRLTTTAMRTRFIRLLLPSARVYRSSCRDSAGAEAGLGARRFGGYFTSTQGLRSRESSAPWTAIGPVGVKIRNRWRSLSGLLTTTRSRSPALDNSTRTDIEPPCVLPAGPGIGLFPQMWFVER